MRVFGTLQLRLSLPIFALKMVEAAGIELGP
jgi:hypothetical protein